MAIAAAPGGKAVFVLSATPRASYVTRISAAAGTAGSPVRLRGGFQVTRLTQFLVSADGRTGYATAASNSMTLERLIAINLGNGTVRNLTSADSSSAPLAITPDGRTAYFPGAFGKVTGTPSTMMRVDTVTGRALPPVRLPGRAMTETIVVSPDGRTVYAASIGSLHNHEMTWLTPIDVATGRAARSVRVPGFAPGITFGPGGTTGYLNGSRELVPVNLSTLRALRPIRLPAMFGPYAWQLTVSPDGRLGYAQLGNRGATIQPVSLAAGTLLRPVTMPPGHGAAGVAAFAPDGKTVWVGLNTRIGHLDGEVVPIQTATQRIGRPVDVNGTPEQIVITG